MPLDPVYFVDRNLGCRVLPDALRNAGFSLVVHDDHFGRRQDVDDPEVIAECGKNGWMLLTADSDLTRRWAKEIKAANIGVFCQTNNTQGPLLWAPRLIKAKAKMAKGAAKWSRPFIAFIHAVPQGTVKKGTLK